jgi:hypothetical protein
MRQMVPLVPRPRPQGSVKRSVQSTSGRIVIEPLHRRSGFFIASPLTNWVTNYLALPLKKVIDRLLDFFG